MSTSKKKSVVVYPEDLSILREGVNRVRLDRQYILETASDHAVEQQAKNDISRCNNIDTLLDTHQDQPDDQPASRPSDNP